MYSSTFYYVLLAIGITATIVFLVLRVKKGGIAALYAKAIASCCFIATALAAMNRNRVFLEFGTLILAGLILGMLGDIWLDLKWIYLQDKNSYLYAGFISFLLGHLCFITAIFRSAPWNSFSIIMSIVLALVIGLIAILMEKP